MARCETCGNEYDKAFQVSMNGTTHTFDSFECAIHALAPTCENCGIRIVGHGLEKDGTFFCCEHCAERAGVTTDVSPHTMRHSFATHLLDGGADVRVVQELLGHASVTTTQVYTLVTVENLREVFATAHPRARD